jgi:DNA-binding CsgD family transcriptional regulator
VVDGTRSRYRVRPELLRGTDGRARGAVVIEPLRALDEDAAMLQLGLTRREADVAATTMRGLTTRDAASALGLSPHTVEHHLRNVFGKLGVGSRSEMTALILGN